MAILALLAIAVQQPLATSAPAFKGGSGLATQCHLSPAMKVFTRLSDMPDVAAELGRQKLILAEPGDAARMDDVVKGQAIANRQFIRGYRFGDRVIVWYIEGGFVRQMHIVGLRLTKNSHGVNAVTFAPGEHLSGEPCFATQALLDGVRAAAGHY